MFRTQFFTTSIRLLQTTKVQRAHSIIQADTFRSRFPAFMEDVRNSLSKSHPDICQDTIEKVMKVLEYNVPHGKLIRGTTLWLAYNHFIPDNRRTPEDEKLACDLGWCLEMLQASILIVDDIVDNSKVRRGQPSWHTLPKTGMNAILDSYFINNLSLDLTKRFLEKPSYRYCYSAIVDTFTSLQMKTWMGLVHEYIIGDKTCEGFTMNNQRTIAIYKAAYYSFILPVFIGMQLCRIGDSDIYKDAERVLILISHFFQCQDDYVDCFGDHSGGTDIVEGKCTWTIAAAVQAADSDQRKILLDNYGKADPNCENRVKEVYRDLDVPKLYAKYEHAAYQEICGEIEKVDDRRLRQLLLEVLEFSNYL